MWFERMTLEVWFDDHQFNVKHDIGESAVKFLSVNDLGMDLSSINLRYGYHTGQPLLREVIAEQYPGLTPDQIVVTSGASEANFSIVSALVQPGDHVIIEHPNYPSLYDVPRSLGCDVSLFKLKYEDNFRPDLDRLKAMVTPKTKLISITHPNNPTGSMITCDELPEIIDFVEERNIILMSDETYKEMDSDNRLPAAATLSENVVSISSMSKCYGLPGIRIGWIATKNQQILDDVLAIREQVTICNNALSEEIAMNVLRRKDDFLDKARKHIASNRAIVAAWIKGHEFCEWVPPEAGVVALPRIKQGVQIDVEQLYQTLVKDYQTFVIPGRCFEMDNRYFRLGFGATSDEIKAGLQNVDHALEAAIATTQAEV